MDQEPLPTTFLGSCLIFILQAKTERKTGLTAESGHRRSAVSQEIRQWDWKPQVQTAEVPKPEKQKMHTGGQGDNRGSVKHGAEWPRPVREQF